MPDITRRVYLVFLRPVIAAGLAAANVARPVTRPQRLAIGFGRGTGALEASRPWVSGRAPASIQAR